MKKPNFGRDDSAVRAKETPCTVWLARATIVLISLSGLERAVAQNTNAPTVAPESGGGTNVIKLAPTTVMGRLDLAREQIVPELGATEFTIDQAQI